MKIIIDPLNSPPPHALTREDLLTIARAVPADWRVPMVMHLKATLPEHGAFERPVVGSTLRMNVCSRGLTPQAARKEVLRALAAEERGFRRLSQAELTEVDRMIAPVIEMVEQAIHHELELPERDDRRSFRASRALQAAGYTWSETFQVLRAIEEEQRQPTSGRLPAWVTRGQAILREAGIDPDTLAPLVADGNGSTTKRND